MLNFEKLQLLILKVGASTFLGLRGGRVGGLLITRRSSIAKNIK